MLREFLVETFIGGATGLANPNIDGLFLDDHWDNPGGLPFPSEVSPPSPPPPPPHPTPWKPVAMLHVGGVTTSRFACVLPPLAVFLSQTEPHADVDMGLSPTELEDILTNWSATMDAVATKLADAKGWSWQDSRCLFLSTRTHIYPHGRAHPVDPALKPGLDLFIPVDAPSESF